MSYHRLLYKWIVQGKSPSIKTDPNTVQNYSKFTHLVMRIDLTRTILSPQLSDFMKNSAIYFSHVFIFSTMFPKSLGFVAMPGTSCIKDTCSTLYISNISKERRNCPSLWLVRQRNRDSHAWKHVTKYKNMRKSMVEFPRKCNSSGDKIAPVNSIRITESVNLL